MNDSTLTYIGHMSFLWRTSTGTQVLIDPFQQPDSGSWFVMEYPITDADAVLVTHDHFDHNAIDRVSPDARVANGPGEVDLEGIRVLGLEDQHTPSRRGIIIPNVIFVIETGGIRYCHLGDNRYDIPAETLAQIGEVDVLIVTVDDSAHLHSFEETARLIAAVGPKVVIPSHYFIEGVTDVASTLLPITNWLSEQENVRMVGDSAISLDADALPDDREVWVFEAALAP